MRKYKRKARIILNALVIAIFILSLLEFNAQLGALTEITVAQQAQIERLQYDNARLYQATALSIEQIAEISKAQEITKIIVPESATEAPMITKEALNTADIVNGGTLTVVITGTLSLLGKAISTLVPALP
jgi:nitrate reductase gamma subunit